MFSHRGPIGSSLISLGIERGDRVGIWSLNNLEWVLTMMAAARIGAILVNLNPAYQRGEIEYAIKKVDDLGDWLTGLKEKLSPGLIIQ